MAPAGSGSFLGEKELRIADASTANDVWNDRELIDIVPSGSVEARLVVQFFQPNNQTGAVHIDSTSFGILAHASQRGDYDANGIVEEADYLVWRSAFGSNTQLQADGNGDGVVNAADYIIWRKNLGPGSATSLGVAMLVPEPISWPLAIGGLLGVVGLRSAPLKRG